MQATSEAPTPQIDEETGLPIMIPGMKQGQKPTLNAADAKTQIRQRLAEKGGRDSQPQPLATRHLDPNYNPAIRTDIGPRVKKHRVKVRGGYVFYVGKNDAFKGPVVCWLTDEEMKGQEHKLEILGDAPQNLSAHAKPQAVKEGSDDQSLADRIHALKSELEVLEAEALARVAKRGDVDEKTLTGPGENEDAKKAALSSDEVPDGKIAGPDHNPDADDESPKATAKGGRPAGKTSTKSKKKTS